MWIKRIRTRIKQPETFSLSRICDKASRQKRESLQRHIGRYCIDTCQVLKSNNCWFDHKHKRNKRLILQSRLIYLIYHRSVGRRWNFITFSYFVDAICRFVNGRCHHYLHSSNYVVSCVLETFYDINTRLVWRWEWWRKLRLVLDLSLVVTDTSTKNGVRY